MYTAVGEGLYCRPGGQEKASPRSKDHSWGAHIGATAQEASRHESLPRTASEEHVGKMLEREEDCVLPLFVVVRVAGNGKEGDDTMKMAATVLSGRLGGAVLASEWTPNARWFVVLSKGLCLEYRT